MKDRSPEQIHNTSKCCPTCRRTCCLTYLQHVMVSGISSPPPSHSGTQFELSGSGSLLRGDDIGGSRGNTTRRRRSTQTSLQASQGHHSRRLWRSAPLQSTKPSRYVTSNRGRLSLAISPWRRRSAAAPLQSNVGVWRQREHQHQSEISRHTTQVVLRLTHLLCFIVSRRGWSENAEDRGTVW